MQKNPCSGLDVNPLHPSMTLQDYQDAVSLEDGLYPIEGDSDDYTPLDANAIGFVGTSLAASLTFSTTEHAVGKWIDGKTLYAKTINVGALPNSTGINYPMGIANLETIWFAFGMAVKSDGTQSFPLPNVDHSAISSQVKVFYNGTSNVIRLQDAADYSGYNGYFTLFYTKTS